MNRPNELVAQEALVLGNERFEDALRTIAAGLLQVEEKEIDFADEFQAYGFDAVHYYGLVEQVNNQFAIGMPANAYAKDETLESFAATARQLLQAPGKQGQSLSSGQAGRFGSTQLPNLAYTLQVGREQMEERFAAIVHNIEQLQEKLHAFADGAEEQPETYVGSAKTDSLFAELFDDREERIRFQEELIRSGRLDKLARLWTSGMDIHWDLLHAGRVHQRLPLPAYPFQGASYWVSHALGENRAFANGGKHGIGNGNGDSNGGESLLQQIDARRSVETGNVVFGVSLERALKLMQEHLVQGMPVLPGAAGLELVHEASSRLDGGSPYTISGVVWRQPIANLHEGAPLELAVVREGDSLLFQIRQGGQSPDEVCVSGNLEIRKNVIGEERSLPIGQIMARAEQQLGKQAIYERFEQIGVSYGPRYQALEQLWFNRNEALGLLQAGDGNRSYGLYSAILDGAFQAVSGIAIGMEDPGLSNASRPMLPFRLEQLMIIRPLPSKAYVHVTRVGDGRYNLLIADESGLICAQMKELYLRADKGQGRANGHIGDMLFAPMWEPMNDVEELTNGLAAEGAASAGAVAIVYAEHSGALEKRLSELYQGEKVIRIRLGQETKRLSEGEWELDVRDATAPAVCINQLGAIRRLYFLGGVDVRRSDRPELVRLQESEQTGALSLLRLVKGMKQCGLSGDKLELTIVTSDAQQIGYEDSAVPYYAGLAGLAATIAAEFRLWSVVCTDIRGRELEENGGQIARKLVSLRALKEWRTTAIRESQLWARTVRPIDLPPAPHVPLREQGVYAIVGGAGGIGSELARYLTRMARATVVLIGRSPLDAAKRAQLARLAEDGAGRVEYVQGDVTDEGSLQAAAGIIKERFGAVNGVFHSAIVLKDGLLHAMDERDFLEVLRIKSRGSLVLDATFGREPLDFMMFFSSGRSLIQQAGQGNYAAACTFKDGYANYMDKSRPFPVKTINWGYWGSIGIVANEFYNEKLAKQGILSIQPEEGMEMIARILAHPIRQAMPLKATRDALQRAGILLGRKAEWYPEERPSVLAHVLEATHTPLPEEQQLARTEAFYREIERYGHLKVMNMLRQAGVMAEGERYSQQQLRDRLRVIPAYYRLFETLLGMLERASFIHMDRDALSAVSPNGYSFDDHEIENTAMRIAALTESQPELKPHFELLEACLGQIKSILSGERKATEVLFPGGSTELVQPVYEGDCIVRYCNELAADVIKNYVAAASASGSISGLANKPKQVTVLEIGAGTGATSRRVLEAIKEYGASIRYLYTDISPGFVRQGRELLGSAYPFAEFEVLNIEEADGRHAGSVDLIIATNVLHATRNINHTIRQAKRLLRANGLIVINELTQVHDFTTLTFGLTEGWWAFTDDEGRMAGSPLLGADNWIQALKMNGFRHSCSGGRLSGPAGHAMQSVIVGESDGAVQVGVQAEQPKPSESKAKGSGHEAAGRRLAGATPDKAAAAGQNVATIAGADAKLSATGMKEWIETYLCAIFADILRMDTDMLDKDKHYEAYGIDSIVVLDISRQLEKDFGSLPATLLFEHLTIAKLAGYFIADHGERVRQLMNERNGSNTAVERMASNDPEPAGAMDSPTAEQASADTAPSDSIDTIVDQLSEADIDKLLEQLLSVK
nr:SDR family NAD(P)-dependent oxidoreductase [Paenibacillus sp. MMS18-CY102]